MIEGWHGDDYLILFDQAEISLATTRYAITEWLPGFEIIGLRGWDDFIVRNSQDQTYTIPTVPLDSKLLEGFELPRQLPSLESNLQFRGKIKWYVKPLVFGGDPNLGDNVIWADHDQHGQLVKWWNEQYSKLKARSGPE